MIGLLSIVAEFETDLRFERQAEGISSAIKRGVKFGRKAKFDNEKVKEAMKMQKEGMINQDIADYFQIDRSTLLRWISRYKKNQNKKKKYLMSHQIFHPMNRNIISKYLQSF